MTRAPEALVAALLVERRRVRAALVMPEVQGALGFDGMLEARAALMASDEAWRSRDEARMQRALASLKRCAVLDG